MPPTQIFLLNKKRLIRLMRSATIRKARLHEIQNQKTTTNINYIKTLKKRKTLLIPLSMNYKIQNIV